MSDSKMNMDHSAIATSIPTMMKQPPPPETTVETRKAFEWPSSLPLKMENFHGDPLYDILAFLSPVSSYQLAYTCRPLLEQVFEAIKKKDGPSWFGTIRIPFDATDGGVESFLRRCDAKTYSTSIDLSRCRHVTGVGLSPLKDSSKLQFIDVRGMPNLSHEDLFPILQAIKSLRRLECSAVTQGIEKQSDDDDDDEQGLLDFCLLESVKGTSKYRETQEAVEAAKSERLKGKEKSTAPKEIPAGYDVFWGLRESLRCRNITTTDNLKCSYEGCDSTQIIDRCQNGDCEMAACQKHLNVVGGFCPDCKVFFCTNCRSCSGCFGCKTCRGEPEDCVHCGSAMCSCCYVRCQGCGYIQCNGSFQCRKKDHCRCCGCWPNKYNGEKKDYGSAAVPTIRNWTVLKLGERWNHQIVDGYIYGDTSQRFEDGVSIYTSPVAEGVFAPGFEITTRSGSRYFLDHGTYTKTNENDSEDD